MTSGAHGDFDEEFHDSGNPVLIDGTFDWELFWRTSQSSPVPRFSAKECFKGGVGRNRLRSDDLHKLSRVAILLWSTLALWNTSLKVNPSDP